MSNEQVKTALADRSSVKSLQSVAVSYCPSYWLPHDVPYWLPAICVMCCPRLACLPLSHPPRSSVPSLDPSCVSCLASPCIVSLPRPVLSHPLRLLARLILSPRLSCRLSCRRAGRSAYRSHLVMRLACRRDTIADVIASFPRPVATVLPMPRLACAVGCFSRRVCAILNAVAMETFRLVAFVPRSHKLPQFTGGGVVVVFQFS